MDPEERARRIAEQQERFRKYGRVHRGGKEGWPGTVPLEQRVRPFLISDPTERTPSEKSEPSKPK